jgi:hypothetical protein
MIFECTNKKYCKKLNQEVLAPVLNFFLIFTNVSENFSGKK